MYAVLLALTWCGLAVDGEKDAGEKDGVLEDEENYAEWEGKAKGTRTSKYNSENVFSSEYGNGCGYQTAASGMKNVSWARSGSAGAVVVLAPEEEVPAGVVHGVPVAYNCRRETETRDDNEETQPMLP